MEEDIPFPSQSEQVDPETELSEGEILQAEETDLPDDSLAEPVAPKRSRLILLLVPLAFAVGLSAGYLLWGLPAREEAAAAAAAQTQVAAQDVPAQITRYDVPVDDDPVLGPEDAAITIIEFSDYECPYCRSWQADVLPRLLETYPDKVRIVYRDFPLSSIHPNAAPAAAAANCANEQDAYWEYHDRLFSMELGLGNQAYQQYASDLGLDAVSFAECLESGRYVEEVQADFDYAAELGVRSTPTFFINGIAVVGAQPFELFQEVIEKELAGEIPK
jgi:protein-disulfide isomerase